MGSGRIRLRRSLQALAVIGAALSLALGTGCRTNMTAKHSSAPSRDINAVLVDHDRELLALPGVVGVCVSLHDDRKTPCLKVMLARKDRNLERSIPRRIEGHPVVTEVTGEFKPQR